MGGGLPRVWSAAGQVDALTGLAPVERLRAVLAAALREGRAVPLVIVVAELPLPTHPVEHARRLALAGAMAWTAFGSALSVGRLGVRRVGVLQGPDEDLAIRVRLLTRMLRDLPGTVGLEPVRGSPEVADWMLRRLCD